MNQRQRVIYQKRHEKLMDMIKSYKLTSQQEEYLLKIKEETELEIAIRYLKSQPNKNYTFPLNTNEVDDDIEEFPGRVSFEQTFYDLCDQNYLPTRQKIQKQTTSRRVKSLGPEKTHQTLSKIRVTQRVTIDKEGDHKKVRLPKIQSSKIVLKSQEKQPIAPIQEKRTFKVKLSKNKNVVAQTERQSEHYGILLTKKLLTETEQAVRIGSTKITINRRIHSPVKSFSKHAKVMTERSG